MTWRLHSQIRAALVCAAFTFMVALPALGQSVKTPKIAQIDLENLKIVLKPNGKPLLVNFWATWCDPCREEFPDLVKLHVKYRDRIDFATVSLDDLAEIKTSVPKFLRKMKSEIPAYLLKATDDDAVIRYVSPDWSGNLPLTIIYSADGKQVYFKNAKFNYAKIAEAIERLSTPTVPAAPTHPDR